MAYIINKYARRIINNLKYKQICFYDNCRIVNIEKIILDLLAIFLAILFGQTGSEPYISKKLATCR